jgi:hypothetical protein
MWAWIASHKTRIAGYAGVIFGFLQMNSDAVKALIPEQYRGISVLILGLIVAIIGHVNANSSGPPAT